MMSYYSDKVDCIWHVFEARRGAVAQACDYKFNKMCVRFALEEMKYLIFSFPRSGNERGTAQRWVPQLNMQCL